MFSVSAAVAGCIIPKGTDVMMFTQQGTSPTVPPTDRPVIESKMQPDQKILKNFSEDIGQDWTDGVIVFDKEFVIYVLVHRGDLVGECEVSETE